MNMKKIVSGMLAAVLLLSAPGAVQSAKAVSTEEGAVSAATTSSYQVKVTANSLTIRVKPDKTSAVKGYLQKNDTVTIVEESVDSRGYTWGKLSTGEGWISLRYTDWSGSAADDDSFDEYKVTVTAASLTIRAKADKSSAVKGYLQKNASVTIVEESVDSRGYTWGKLSNGKGWISLRYTSWNTAGTDDDASASVEYQVKVTASSLNIRNKPTSSSAVVGSLTKGKVVTIVSEQDDVNGKPWGELDDGRGWIYLGYTKVYSGSDFEPYDVQVTANTLNIRAGATASSAAVGFLRQGNVMTIVAEQKDSNGSTWGKLDNGDGWISLRYTTKVSSTPVFAQYKVKVNVNSLRVRAGAGVNTAITGGLTKGTVVTIVAEKKDSNGNTWGKLSNGLGWIYLNYTKKA